MSELAVVPTAPASSDPGGRGWNAELELTFDVVCGKTRLVRRRHVGPLTVQRPFHPERGGACHVYLLHPPGGIVGGDRLDVTVDALPGAEVVVTTPAATKFYRSAGMTAVQRARVTVAPGSVVEWLPQETLVFGGAHAENRLSVDVAPGGRFLGWDICCLGRPASGDAFESGSYRGALEVSAGGRPVVVERGRFSASAEVRRRRFGLGGSSVFGTFVALSDRPELAELVRSALPEGTAGDHYGVTARRFSLVCRYLGDSVARAREAFVRAWSVVRPALLDRPVSLPRIWAT
ncbi:MAG TPA: urease accessory protein UreD [Polyangiaceae bacterium]|nr:urease accessory protein UreD [Polyangiaceae bacterium]